MMFCRVTLKQHCDLHRHSRPESSFRTLENSLPHKVCGGALTSASRGSPYTTSHTRHSACSSARAGMRRGSEWRWRGRAAAAAGRWAAGLVIILFGSHSRAAAVDSIGPSAGGGTTADHELRPAHRQLTLEQRPATCQGYTCDFLIGNMASATCAYLEDNYSCDCTGCDNCPTSSPTGAPPTMNPSISPEPTLTPTTPMAPTTDRPSPAPTRSFTPTTLSPTPAPIESEVATFAQLQAAISQVVISGAKLIVALVADIMFAETLNIDSHVVLHSREGAVLRGGGSRRLFRVKSGGRLTGANVTLRGGYSSTDGGAVDIKWYGMMDFVGCTFTGNTAYYADGGAVHVYGGSAEFKDCTIKGNSAYYADGGALHVYGGTADFKDCKITGNRILGDYDWGGAVSASYATVQFKGCVITGNANHPDGFGGAGGAVGSFWSTARFQDCTINGNSATYGGAVVSEYGATSFQDCTIAGNSVWAGGGAVELIHSTADWKHCTIKSNSAYKGGMVYSDVSIVGVHNCTVTGNSAVRYGGALYNGLSSTAGLRNCTITGNVAGVCDDCYLKDPGGGVIFNEGSKNLDGCVITGNSASSGAVVYSRGGALAFNDCTVTTNMAERHGGVAYSSGDITWNDCKLTGNSASLGGVLYQSGSEPRFGDCTLTDNRCALRGAIVYSESSASTRFERCTFLGEYDNNTCLLYTSDADSKFFIYYPRMFESGVVCSASKVVVYNSSVAIPASTSYETAILTCQSSEIFDYCAYDCSTNDGTGGIMCSCTVDGVSLDPYLLDDPVSGCQTVHSLTYNRLGLRLQQPNNASRTRCRSHSQTLATNRSNGT